LRASNILSIDVEELYHAEYVRRAASSQVLRARPRARIGVEAALKLLRDHGASATFFFVGEVAEREPSLIEELEEEGHEIGFHGYRHKPLWETEPQGFREELSAFKELLRRPCKGFRAPSFSINSETAWALDIIAREGFVYDSSVFPIKTSLYGLPGAPSKPYRPSLIDPRLEDEASPLVEFPITILELGPIKLPVGGGFYLRLTPAWTILAVVKSLNKKGIPAVIFVHSWELDLSTPIVPLGDPLKSFITYYNIKTTGEKLSYLLSRAEFTSFENYLEAQGLI